MNLPSKYLERAIEEISQLPGIGKRSALRLALHLLRAPDQQTENLSNALTNLKKHITYCDTCNNISDKQICEICSNTKRNQKIICVVEDIQDVLAIENTNQYNGVYHVLGGKISPIEGIGPSDLSIDSLITKVETKSIEEIIFALNSSLESDTTNFYIYKKLNKFNIKITAISKGIAIGDELEYTDEATLSNSLINRTLFSYAF